MTLLEILQATSKIWFIRVHKKDCVSFPITFYNSLFSRPATLYISINLPNEIPLGFTLNRNYPYIVHKLNKTDENADVDDSKTFGSLYPLILRHGEMYARNSL